MSSDRGNRPISPPGFFPIRRTGLLWSLGLRNPLVRLEWFGWKRRPVRRFLAGLIFLLCIGGIFTARNGFPPGSGGYSEALSRAIRGTIHSGSGIRATRVRMFWATIIAIFEKGVVRLTTLLPWLLVIRSVSRLRRSGMWDSLRMTFLKPRDWVAGLAGPPIVLAAVALAAFLAGVILPDFLVQAGNYPPDMRMQYRLALVSTIPFIGLEGAANGLLVAAITLHVALQSRRIFTVVGRSLGWILAMELVHSFVLYWLSGMAEGYGRSGSYPRFLVLSYGFQLTFLAVVKGVIGIILFARIARNFGERLQQEAERMG